MSPRSVRRIEQGIDKLDKDKRVVFGWVRGGTGKDLMDKLLEGEWHIFHFIGHGGVEPQSPADPSGNSFDQSGFIVMVDEDGKPAKKFASDLAMMLADARKSLRLVVLNCCESARINVGEKFGNPAMGLMMGGSLPAVVAMQFPISDDAAIRMSEGFYKALANNVPVDDAVKMARRFIRDKSRIEFGIPVLYMRSADGKIFEVDNPVVTPPEADTFRSATKEELQQRRDEFLLAAEAAPTSGAELELLARRGQDLVAELKDDAQLARRVARIYLDLGAQQQRLGQTSNAIASFAYAIKLDPKNAEYYVRRANFYALAGFPEAALADITAAIALKPDSAEILLDQGDHLRDGLRTRKQAGVSCAGRRGVQHGYPDESRRAEISGFARQLLCPARIHGRGHQGRRPGHRDGAGKYGSGGDEDANSDLNAEKIRFGQVHERSWGIADLGEMPCPLRRSSRE